MMDIGQAFHTSCPCPRASSAGVTIARILPVGEFGDSDSFADEHHSSPNSNLPDFTVIDWPQLPHSGKDRAGGTVLRALSAHQK